MHEQSLSLLTFCVDTDDMEDISIDIKIIIISVHTAIAWVSNFSLPKFYLQNTQYVFSNALVSSLTKVVFY